MVPEAAAGMEKGSASITIEQKIYYFVDGNVLTFFLIDSQIRMLLSCQIFKKVSPPSDNAFPRRQHIAIFSN